MSVVIPPELTKIIDADPEIISGAARFVGTRVPVQALLDSLAHGQGVDDFLEGFPDVTREQALAVVVWQQNESRKKLGLNIAS